VTFDDLDAAEERDAELERAELERMLPSERDDVLGTYDLPPDDERAFELPYPRPAA
jgi:hypothetical protein